MVIQTDTTQVAESTATDAQKDPYWGIWLNPTVSFTDDKGEEHSFDIRAKRSISASDIVVPKVFDTMSDDERKQVEKARDAIAGLKARLLKMEKGETLYLPRISMKAYRASPEVAKTGKASKNANLLFD